MAVTVRELFANSPPGSGAAPDTEVTGITTDSRLVEPGDVFAALVGSNFDGRRFAAQALDRGAAVLLAEAGLPLPDGVPSDAPWVFVRDAASCAFETALKLYRDHAEALTCIGITGTNGKTSTAFLTRAVLDEAGIPAGMLGTVRYVLGPGTSNGIKAPLTTPQAVEVYRFLATMHRRGMSAAVMEVSSQGLDMGRAEGIRFDGAVFTNLTRDHLDYHGSMDRYLEAKLRLFRALGPDSFAVVNVDDPHAEDVLSASSCMKVAVTLAAGDAVQAAASKADRFLRGVVAEESSAGAGLQVSDSDGPGFEVFLPLIGRFNALNAVSAAAVGIALGVGPDVIISALGRGVSVPGRMQRIDAGQPFLVVVDYAHTPDGLEKALLALRGITDGRLFAVFGCGGDRDPGKRPQMGALAARIADVLVVTSDNPRSERPEFIIRQILEGVPAGSAVIVEQDRKLAIRQALLGAAPGDTVLIAGKGHEDYQIVGDRRLPFDDAAVAAEILRSEGLGASPDD